MKRLSSWILCVLLTLALTVTAFGDAPLLRGGYEVDIDDILCHSLPVGGSGTLTVLADGEPTEHYTMSTIADENFPITYVCVVDYSSNLKQQQKDQMLTVLQTINSNMRDIDEMMLMGMGNELDIGKGVLDTKLKRDDAISGRWPTYQQTFVDRCVKKLAEELTIPMKYDDKNLCVILISDGIDDINSSQVKAEAVEAIRSSGLNVNTIALMAPPLTQYAQTHADNLGKFAEVSSNGIYLNPTVQNISAEDAAKQIMDATLSAPVIRVDGTRLDHSSDVVLEFRYAANDQTYSSTVTVDVEDLSTIPVYTPPTEPVTQATEETSEPIYETAPIDTQKGGNGFAMPKINQATLLLIGGILAAVLGVVLMVVAVVAWRRDPDEDDEDELDDEDDEDDADEDDESEEADEEADFVPVIPAQPKAEPELPDFGYLDFGFDAPASPVVSQEPTFCMVAFLQKDMGRSVLRLTLDKGTVQTIGRTNRADFILDGNDNNLSGCHLSLMWDGTRLLLQDNNSTNGTYVGGQLLTPGQWIPVENGTEVFAGSFPYVLSVDME